jgi:hypothetical protein
VFIKVFFAQAAQAAFVFVAERFRSTGGPAAEPAGYVDEARLRGLE